MQNIDHGSLSQVTQCMQKKEQKQIYGGRCSGCEQKAGIYVVHRIAHLDSDKCANLVTLALSESPRLGKFTAQYGKNSE